MSGLRLAPTDSFLATREAICTSRKWHMVVPACKKGFGQGPPKSVKTKTKHTKQVDSIPAEEHNNQKKAVILQEDSRELQSVIKSVEKEHSKRRKPGLNIDRDVAARGKVDFVKVESWGEGSQDESSLDNLRVKSFSPALTSSDNDAPFYERVVRRLQLLQSKGDISIVQAQTLPPFQDWVFGERRYLQYLVDQHAVFDAVRFTISSIENLVNNNTDSKRETTIREAAMAVALFNDSLGLERSKALQNDINVFSKALSLVHGVETELPKPTTQTMAYVKYLNQLQRIACGEENERPACLRLLAHIFALYVSHLTTGMRIGAKALDSLPILKKSKGVSFYRDYPQHVVDPLKLFIATINKITEFIVQQEDQELIMDELPRAIQKTSLLLVVLAVKE